MKTHTISRSETSGAARPTFTPSCMVHRWSARSLLRCSLLVVIPALGCSEARDIENAILSRTPHERYEHGLRSAGLHESALGHDWIMAARRALETPHPVGLPSRETGYFAPSAASATAYSITLRRGERLSVDISTEGSPPFSLFIDLFAVSNDSTRSLRHITSADSGRSALEHEAERDGELVIRVQPELLRGGRYTLSMRTAGALAFPVAGRDSRAVQSFFGADRDGGRRRHHGVDVFAPRGTPVVAAAPGHVTNVGETSLGGKVVWVWDPDRGQSMYYAHLDEQLVRPGRSVKTGDTLGLIGNTGNARNTPPHLHFGIYRRGYGPLDPFPYVRRPDPEPSRPAANLERLGEWARTTRAAAELHTGPATKAPLVRRLERSTALRVLGATGRWYRVMLPDSATGYIAAAAVEAARGAVPGSATLARAAREDDPRIRDHPAPAAAVVDSLERGATVAVVAKHGDYLLVRAGTGEEERLGWLRGSVSER